MIMNELMTDDEWNEHVMNGEAYAAEHLTIAIPALIPLTQLYNPVESGVRVRLRCIEHMAFFGGAINQNIRRDDVALVSGSSPPFGPPQNLLFGGAAPKVEFRFANLPANVGSPFWLILSAGQTRKQYPPLQQDWGHDLTEGQGITNNGALGGFIILGYQWVEVPL